MAARATVVEKRAAFTVVGSRRGVNCDDLSSDAAGRARVSIINGFVLAIVGAGGRDVVGVGVCRRRRLGGKKK